MILFGLAWWEKKLKSKYEPDEHIKELQRQYYERNYPKPDDQKVDKSRDDPPESRKNKTKAAIARGLFYV